MPVLSPRFHLALIIASLLQTTTACSSDRDDLSVDGGDDTQPELIGDEEERTTLKLRKMAVDKVVAAGDLNKEPLPESAVYLTEQGFSDTWNIVWTNPWGPSEGSVPPLPEVDYQAEFVVSVTPPSFQHKEIREVIVQQPEQDSLHVSVLWKVIDEEEVPADIVCAPPGPLCGQTAPQFGFYAGERKGLDAENMEVTFSHKAAENE